MGLLTVPRTAIFGPQPLHHLDDGQQAKSGLNLFPVGHLGYIKTGQMVNPVHLVQLVQGHCLLTGLSGDSGGFD